MQNIKGKAIFARIRIRWPQNKSNLLRILCTFRKTWSNSAIFL